MKKRPPKLTRKQEAFVRELVENPKQSATASAMKTYGKPDKPITYQTANAIAVENLQKPAIQTELAKYTKQVEDTLYRAVVDWGDSEQPRKREIALDSAKFIHDKVHGKATQKVETRSEQVTISIDLTGVDTSSPGEPTE